MDALGFAVSADENGADSTQEFSAEDTRGVPDVERPVLDIELETGTCTAPPRLRRVFVAHRLEPQFLSYANLSGLGCPSRLRRGDYPTRVSLPPQSSTDAAEQTPSHPSSGAYAASWPLGVERS
jgi:hypothetical protein